MTVQSIEVMEAIEPILCKAQKALKTEQEILKEKLKTTDSEHVKSCLTVNRKCVSALGRWIDFCITVPNYY